MSEIAKNAFCIVIPVPLAAASRTAEDMAKDIAKLFSRSMECTLEIVKGDTPESCIYRYATNEFCGIDIMLYKYGYAKTQRMRGSQSMVPRYLFEDCSNTQDVMSISDIFKRVNHLVIYLRPHKNDLDFRPFLTALFKKFPVISAYAMHGASIPMAIYTPYCPESANILATHLQTSDGDRNNLRQLFDGHPRSLDVDFKSRIEIIGYQAVFRSASRRPSGDFQTYWCGNTYVVEEDGQKISMTALEYVTQFVEKWNSTIAGESEEILEIATLCRTP